VNDTTGQRVAQQCVRMMMKYNGSGRGCVTVLGITFKENVPDIRNTRVIDIVRELKSFGVAVQVHDPMASNEEVEHEYGISLTAWDRLQPAEAVILAVPHAPLIERGWELCAGLLKNRKGAVLDLKARLPKAGRPDGIELWRL
jgi:UDP-N-acetyl-D-galactosamine dehydrogenase